jgi:peptidoglycan/xylan/chitin deacetylase (PgdA/CDA1 family)
VLKKKRAVTERECSGLHGYTHEHVSQLSEQQQRDVLTKSIDVLTKFTGKKPKGWTAPAWDTSKEAIRLLEECEIVSSSTVIVDHC